MIFRVDGEVGVLLALTTILKEWKRRNIESRVCVETYTPGIFENNPDVDVVAPYIDEIGEYYDMSLIRWREIGRPVVEVFAEHILGDRNIKNWKPFMADFIELEKEARRYVESISQGKKVVSVAFRGNMIDSGVAMAVMERISSMGYIIDDISTVEDWRVVRSRIKQADFFVGEDGDHSAVSFTTEVPSVVCYSNRIPDYFPPFRKIVPFIPLVPSRDVCDRYKFCHMAANIEYSKVYTQPCLKKTGLCKKRDLVAEVSEALEKIDQKQ